MRSVLLLLALSLSVDCSREPATQAARIAPPFASPDYSAFIAAVDALAGEALERGPIAGLSIAVAQRGETVMAKGYGYADREAGLAASANTSYPIASITKQFTAAAILRLADQGKLNLDDPLEKFFPGSRNAIAVLTLRQLLSHTSGLTRAGPAPRSAAQSVLRRGGTARRAGERWDYSNYNFSLLGLVIERVSGRSYADYVRDELAAPAQLTGTAYCEDGAAVPGRTRDYESGRRTVEPTPYWTQPRFFAAGGLCSTVLDLVRWQHALDEGRVLTRAALQGMRTATRLSDGLEADYGFGTRLGFTGRHRKSGHTGGGRSNKAVLARYHDDDATIAVVVNTEGTNPRVLATDLEARIARLLFGLPEPGSGGVPVPAEELRRNAGEYRDGGRLMLVVTEGGMLKLRTGPRQRDISPLITEGGELFVKADAPSVELRFLVSGDKTRGYARYHNGWFVGLGVRTGDLPASGRLQPRSDGSASDSSLCPTRRRNAPGWRRSCSTGPDVGRGRGCGP
jgi:CubicO group peptidase (beta-lactamase class C family)